MSQLCNCVQCHVLRCKVLQIKTIMQNVKKKIIAVRTIVIFCSVINLMIKQFLKCVQINGEYFKQYIINQIMQYFLMLITNKIIILEDEQNFDLF